MSSCHTITPISNQELIPYKDKAIGRSIHSYQIKVGSILYAAVITRLDIAFAASRLARHSYNPNLDYYKVVNKVLYYLYHTYNLGLCYSNRKGLEIALNTSFANNLLNRKSSQGFTIKLFKGIIY